MKMQISVGLTSMLLASFLLTGCGDDADAAKPLNGKKIGKFLSEDATLRMEAPVTVKCPQKIPAGNGKKVTVQVRDKDFESRTRRPVVWTGLKQRRSMTRGVRRSFPCSWRCRSRSRR